jgi:hypothetical protein
MSSGNGQPHVVHEIHDQHDDAHGDAERNDAYRFAQGDEAGGDDGAGATPKATTPCSIDDCERLRPRATSDHLMTMNCSVAPAPQNSVVTASEIWPRRSRQSSFRQWLNSWIR